MLARAIKDGVLATNAASGLRLGSVQPPRAKEDVGERVLNAAQWAR